MKTERVRVVVVLLAVLSGCAESNGSIVERGRARRDQINASYDDMFARSVRDWNGLIRDVRHLLRRRIAVDPDGRPLRRVDQSQELAAAAASCRQTEGLHGEAQVNPDEDPWYAGDKPEPDAGAPVRPPEDPWQDADAGSPGDDCWRRWSTAYLAALRMAYPRTDIKGVWEAYEESGRAADIETTLAKSQNAALEATVAERVRQVESLKRRDLARINAAREHALANAHARMMEELAEAEEERRQTGAAIAGFLQAVGDGLQGAARGTVGASQESAVPKVCSSDFDCGFGMACVKRNYASDGVCLRAVNDFGTQDYSRSPRLDSVLPKMPSPGDCQFNTDCPIGFQCDQSSGTCVR